MFVKRMCKALGLCLVGVLLAGMVWSPARPASPSIYTVCAAGCDFTTIQAALDDDRVVPGDTIQVMAPIHTEANIVVRKDITIQGQGAAETIVQAHDTPEHTGGRVVLVSEGVTVTIRDLTLRHGNPPYKDDYWRSGGGILNKGSLTLENCVVSHNIANTGGGILTIGALEVYNCTISHNVADRIAPLGWDDGDGGGIEVDVNGTLTLVNSTVTDNDAAKWGGGVYLDWNTSGTIINCTISGNRAVTYGGGLYTKRELHLNHCTIVDNQAQAKPAINQAGARMPKDHIHGGGGVYLRAGTLHFTNTIIANNAKKDCTIGYPDQNEIKGSLGANSNNLIADGGCEAAYSGDPLLGPLADNGGPVQTHALLPGSPAIDAVPAISCTLATDQRELPRPVACTSPDTPGDLGAFEVQADECVPLTPTPSPTPVSEATPPTPAPTAVPATPTPTPLVVPAPLNDLLLPVWGLLGVLFASLAGLVILWLWRRGHDGPGGDD